MQASFTLTEQFAFGSQYSWRLKESEIRFRGSGEYQRLVLQRIPASAERIASFGAALDLIQVWDWRNDYNPNDIGCAVDDGSAWSFAASFERRNCRCGGVNAYPSFADVNLTTIAPDRGRFLLLRAAMYECFQIEWYILQAKLFVELEARQRGEKPAQQGAEADGSD
jgi:hypothetical protein